MAKKYKDEFKVSQRTAHTYIELALDILDNDTSYNIEKVKEGKTTYFLNVENKTDTHEEE